MSCSMEGTMANIYMARSCLSLQIITKIGRPAAFRCQALFKEHVEEGPGRRGEEKAAASPMQLH